MEKWKNLDFVATLEHVAIDGQRIALVPLLKEMLKRDTGHLAEFQTEGALKRQVKSDEIALEPSSYEEVLNGMMAKRGGRLIHRNLGSKDGVYLFDDGMVDLSISGTYVQVHGISYDETFLTEISDYLNANWAPPEKIGHIDAIVKQGMHLGLSSIGNAGIKLVDGNYTPKVMEDYRFAINDLLSTAPSGRIVIMRGAPGTGKTHLIRAMLLEVPDAMFVLISPDMVTNLSGPELLPLLMSHRSGTGPIVLILEDADKCLVARDKDNINSIQALLNLGDGILGSLLDLRIVATTNAHELHMEEAIMRPGRLSKMLEVGPLDINTARSVFRRLLPEVKLPDELTKKFKEVGVNAPGFKMTLAEAYALARKYGWVPEARKVEEEDEEEDFE